MSADARGDDDAVELRHDLRIDIPVTLGIGGGLVVYNAFLRESIVPTSCNWCDGSRPDGVNAVDRFFRDNLGRHDGTVASTMSSVFAYGIAPVTGGALLVLAGNHEGRLKNAPVDIILTGEAVVTAIALAEVFKAAFSRERPNIHTITDDAAHEAEAKKAGSLASFPSGHTLSVFAMTSAAGTIASMRHYSLAPLIWGVGAVFGVATAYLRIAANQHYLTDTLGGAALGMGVGAAVPLLFHGPVKPTTDGQTAGVRIDF